MIILQVTPAELSAMVHDAVKAALCESTAASSQPAPVSNKPITTQELCEYLGITPQTVIRWKKKGKIPFFSIGTAIRFNLDAVLKALSEDQNKKRG